MLTKDYYQLDNLLWYSENIFGALVDTNPDHIIIADNNEFLNNSFRYESWIPLFYYANLYNPRYPGFDNFSVIQEHFLSLYDWFYQDSKCEILVLNYDAFSPKERYNYRKITPIGYTNKIAYGVRLIPQVVQESSVVVMNSNAHELFYCGGWQNNKYFGG